MEKALYCRLSGLLEPGTGADANSLRSCVAAAVGAAHRGRSAHWEACVETLTEGGRYATPGETRTDHRQLTGDWARHRAEAGGAARQHCRALSHAGRRRQ